MNAVAGGPEVSIIIPTWNNTPRLSTLLSSISSQTFRSFEIIIVDRHSEDGCAEAAEKWGALYFDQLLGRSAARNFGADKSRGKYLLFLDSDMELTAGVLEACHNAVTNCDALCLREKALVGGNYWARARALERDNFFGTLYYESARFYRSDVFKALGGYDENMVGFEDMDLQAKLLEAKFRLGWSEALILHHEEDVGLREYLTKRRLYASTAGIYARRHLDYWKELSSVTRRVRLLLSSLTSADSLKSAFLVPGLIFIRLLEYVLTKEKTLVSRS